MILITGGTGAIGKHLTALLVQNGNRVRLLALPDDPSARDSAGDKVEVCYGDIRDRGALQGCFDGITTVFHLAAVILSPGHPERFRQINVRGTANVVEEAQQAGVKHIIHVSSASVDYQRTNPYAVSKHQAEEIISSSAVPQHTIVRPTLVYDEHGGQEFLHFVNYLKRYPVIPFIGKGTALKSPVHARDLVRGLAQIPGNPQAYGKTYNFSGGESLTIRRMAELLLEQMGKRKVIIPVPVLICRVLAQGAALAARISGKEPLLTWQTISGIIQDADLDNRTAREDLGYAPRPFSLGIRELTTLKNCLK